jgi:hypothetical protein
MVSFGRRTENQRVGGELREEGECGKMEIGLCLIIGFGKSILRFAMF